MIAALQDGQLQKKAVPNNSSLFLTQFNKNLCNLSFQRDDFLYKNRGKSTYISSNNPKKPKLKHQRESKIYSNYTDIKAGIGNIKASYIPDFGMEQMDFTTPSSKQEKYKGSGGWSQIAQGVIGPFAPKHSAFHKHLKDAKKARYEKIERLQTKKLYSAQATVINNSKQRPKNFSPGLPPKQNLKVANNNQKVRNQQNMRLKKVGFLLQNENAIEVKEDKEPSHTLKKIEDMKNAFKHLEDCHIESKKLLQQLKKRFSKSIDKKSRITKDENQVKVILGPQGPICPIDYRKLLRDKIKRWRENKDKKKFESQNMFRHIGRAKKVSGKSKSSPSFRDSQNIKRQKTKEVNISSETAQNQITHDRINSNLSTVTVGEIQKDLSKKTKSIPRNLSLSYQKRNPKSRGIVSPLRKSVGEQKKQKVKMAHY